MNKLLSDHRIVRAGAEMAMASRYTFKPKEGGETQYFNWISVASLTRCKACKERTGFLFIEIPEGYVFPPLHPNCRCKFERTKSIVPGTATVDGSDGADHSVFFDNKLPDAEGRIWYEADINYVAYKRSSHRLVYSNDGLVFVTYDHYESFFEIKEADTPA